MPRPSLTTWFVLAALGGAGCVIPVAPQFDDAEQNYPPFVVSSDPGVGAIFTPGTTGEERVIAVTLGDHNLQDRLFIRWLVDYPSSDLNLAHLIPPGQLESPPPEEPSAVRQTIRFQPRCAALALSQGLHRLVMSVADRRFLDDVGDETTPAESRLDTAPEGANRVRLVWLLNCP